MTAPARPCTVSYLHDPHDDCPGRDETTCVEPTCYATATTGFVGKKSGTGDLTYRTCSTHKTTMAVGLVSFGLIAEADFTVSADEPVCTSCGDRPLGCPRCTDRDGDTR